jgi:hypothetical protein
MIPIPNGAVLRECIDRFKQQERFQTLPDFIQSLLDDHLNYLRQKEWDQEVARGEINKRLKDLKNNKSKKV